MPRVKLENLSPEERAALQDFKKDITGVFNDLYEDKWDQERWDRAVDRYTRIHDTSSLMRVINSKQRNPEEFWENLREEFIKGPPIFVRPGWKSPLLGHSVGLDWLDDLVKGESGFEWVQGQDEWEDGWRDKKLVVLEFWTSWCGFTHLAETYDASVLMAGINSEEIFSGDEIDIDSIFSFVQTRNDMNFPIVIDSGRTAVRELFDKAGRRAVPTVIIISIMDKIVHFVGDPGDVDGAVDRLLDDY